MTLYKTRERATSAWIDIAEVLNWDTMNYPEVFVRKNGNACVNVDNAFFLQCCATCLVVLNLFRGCLS